MSKRNVLFATVALLTASSGWLFALVQEDQSSARIQSLDRQGSRVLYFAQVDGEFAIPAQFSVHYGAPAWKAEYEAQKDQISADSRVRLGKDFWTNLDTNVPLKMGEVIVQPGYYYLALHHGEGDEWALVVLDATAIHREKTDAFWSGDTEGGQIVPLTLARAEDSDETMRIEFVEQDDAFQLELQWGPYLMTTPVHPQM